MCLSKHPSWNRVLCFLWQLCSCYHNLGKGTWRLWFLGAGKHEGIPAEPLHLIMSRFKSEGSPKGTDGHTLNESCPIGSNPKGRCIWFEMTFFNTSSTVCWQSGCFGTSGSKYTNLAFKKLTAVSYGALPGNTNIMTVLKGSQHWNGLPKSGGEALFLMTCEHRIFTSVWDGLGEACLASWWWMRCLWNCFLILCLWVYECYLTVLKCIQSTTKCPERKVFCSP